MTQGSHGSEHMSPGESPVGNVYVFMTCPPPQPGSLQDCLGPLPPLLLLAHRSHNCSLPNHMGYVPITGS